MSDLTSQFRIAPFSSSESLQSVHLCFSVLFLRFLRQYLLLLSFVLLLVRYLVDTGNCDMCPLSPFDQALLLRLDDRAIPSIHRFIGFFVDCVRLLSPVFASAFGLRGSLKLPRKILFPLAASSFPFPPFTQVS